MKHIFLLLLLSIFNSTIAQKTSTDEIIRISDSIMTAQVGTNLKQYFEISAGSYYRYVKPNKTISYGKFLNHKRVKKNVQDIMVLYSFNYKAIKGVKGGVWITLDKNLNLISIGDLNFIPEFLKNKSESNFILPEEAREIAINSFKENGFEIENAELSYNSKLKKYTYSVCNKLTKVKNSAGKDSGEMEIVEIDAVYGSIIENRKGIYGLIIR